MCHPTPAVAVKKQAVLNVVHHQPVQPAVEVHNYVNNFNFGGYGGYGGYSGFGNCGGISNYSGYGGYGCCPSQMQVMPMQYNYAQCPTTIHQIQSDPFMMAQSYAPQMTYKSIYSSGMHITFM